MKGQQRHLPGWKLRPDRPEARDGLRYISSARSSFRLRDGKPDIEAIAEAAGVDWRNLHSLRKHPDKAPTGYTVGALVALAASVHGVTPLTAHGRIFRFVDPRVAEESAAANVNDEASAA